MRFPAETVNDDAGECLCGGDIARKADGTWVHVGEVAAGPHAVWQ